ncbi:MAG: tetratricopeptide repeat protein [Desulfobacteraceae bacterium]
MTRKKGRKEAQAKREASSHIDIENVVDDALRLFEEGERRQGEKILEKLRKKHGQHPHVIFGLGVLEAFDNNVDKAILLFKRATQISPDLAAAHFNLGVAYQKKFQIPGMVTAFRRVVEIGEAGGYMVKHAQDMLNMLEKQTKETDGISLDEYLFGYEIFNQGVEYMTSQSWDDAIAKFEETIKITPKHVQSYGNLGICYSSLGRQEEALRAYDKAIELDPNYEPALINRRIAESLKEGECLGGQVKTIEYYNEYSLKNRSYIEEYAEMHGIMPE